MKSRSPIFERERGSWYFKFQLSVPKSTKTGEIQKSHRGGGLVCEIVQMTLTLCAICPKLFIFNTNRYV